MKAFSTRLTPNASVTPGRSWGMPLVIILQYKQRHHQQRYQTTILIWFRRTHFSINYCKLHINPFSVALFCATSMTMQGMWMWMLAVTERCQICSLNRRARANGEFAKSGTQCKCLASHQYVCIRFFACNSFLKYVDIISVTLFFFDKTQTPLHSLKRKDQNKSKV